MVVGTAVSWLNNCMAVMVTTAVGCRSQPLELEAETTPIVAETAVVVPQPTLTLTTPAQSTDTPAPPPIASPTLDRFATWQQITAVLPGWQISVPPDWTSLTEELEPAQTATPYGVMTLLAADSERTGVTLLANKPVASGAFVIGVLLDGEPTVSVPLVGLQGLLGAMETVVTPLGPISSQTQFMTETSLSGAVIDVVGHPLPFVETTVARLRTRILYLLPTEQSPGERQQLLLLFSAPAEQWASYTDTFAAISQTIVPRAGSAGSGTTRLRSSLVSGQTVSSNLQRNGQDVWTLSTDAPQYLTLLLKPESDRLDLAATIVDPFGTEMVQVDNGFSNSSERILDFYLSIGQCRC